MEKYDDFYKSLFSSGDPPIRLARRLRFDYDKRPQRNAYQWVLRGGHWDALGNRSKPSDPARDDGDDIKLDDLQGACVGIGLLGTPPSVTVPTISQTATLPSLERVVLGSLQNSKGKEWDGLHFLSDADKNALPLSIPLSILTFATIRHYCQSMRAGPLCLDEPVLVSNPPRVCTYHITPEYLGLTPNNYFPVVLGAINRYIFPYSYLITCGPTGQIVDDIDELSVILMPLMTFGQAKNVLVLPGEAGGPMRTDKLSNHKDTVAKTDIEIYGLVKCVNLTLGEMYLQRGYYLRNQHFPQRHNDFARRPPSSLKPAQELANTMAGDFKGRVVLKNRADTPACTACDLDCQAQWRRSEENGKYYVPG